MMRLLFLVANTVHVTVTSTIYHERTSVCTLSIQPCVGHEVFALDLTEEDISHWLGDNSCKNIPFKISPFIQYRVLITYTHI